MSKFYPFISSLCLLLTSQVSLVAADFQERGDAVALLLESSTLSEWQLISGGAETNDVTAYLGEFGLVLDGSENGTLLKHAFTSEPDSTVRTELLIFPDIAAGGTIAINLNGVSLSFDNEVSGGLNIYYHNTVDRVQGGSFENQTWLHLELIQNYGQGRASLKINDRLLFEAQYFDSTTTGEYVLDLKGSGQNKLHLDQMTVSFEAPVLAFVDSDEDGLPDSWESRIVSFDQNDALKTIYDLDPNSDDDGDGISNADEFAQGTSPTDYYNGQLPTIEKISGDLQRGAPGSYVSEPLVIKVSDTYGQPLVNAPVTFEVIDGNARLSVYKSEQASTYQQLTVRTNSKGLVKYGNPLLHDSATVLFYDDFDEERLDREKWDISTLQVGRTEYGNEPELLTTDEGVHVARLQLDTYNAANPEELFYGTSIRTYLEFEQDQVVEFEARTRLVNTSESPISRGLVGAFFSYSDSTQDELTWEYLSNQMSDEKILTNIYNNGFPLGIGDAEYAIVDTLNVANFNTYTTRWSKDKIEYFLNGQLIRTGPNREVLRNVPEDPLQVYLSLFAPKAGFAEAYDADLKPVGNQSLNESYFFDVDYVQVRTPQLEVLRPAGTVPVYLKQGVPGESTIKVTAESELESVAVSFSTLSEHNERPNIILRDTGDLVYGDQYIVSWDAEDKEGDAKIALYCDTDSFGADGTLIVGNLSASDSVQYIWKTAGVEEGNYHLYAVIDDGVNDPVTAYSEQSIYVPNAAYSENQLSNGGLELGEGLGYSKIEGWQSSGDTWHYSKKAYQGVFHARLVENAAYYQDVATVAGQPWCALVYALNPSEEPFEGTAAIQLSFYDKEGNNLAEYHEFFDDDSSRDHYIPLKVNAVAPEKSVWARVTLSLEGAGSVYFDEASLCKKIELNNSSFELGRAAGTVDMEYWKSFGEAYLYGKGSRLGGWHIAAFGTFPEDGRENYSGCYQEVPAQEGELWHASIYACNPLENPIQGNSEAKLKLVFVDEEGITLAGGDNTSKSIFSNSLKDQHLLLDVSAYAPPGTAFVRIVPLFIQKENATGCVYFDDARLYKEPGARNAGFELGDGYGSRLIWGWTPFGEGVYHDHTYPLDGDHHLRLANENDVIHTGVYQDFPVIAGEAWRAKLFARVLPTDPLQGDTKAHLGLYYHDKDGNVVGGGELISNQLDADSPAGYYVPLAVAGIAPEGAVRLRLVPVIRGNGTGTVFIDRVSIEKVHKSHRDRDDDGLPDLWEQAIIDTSERDVLRLRSDIVATEDLDKDGLDNRGEFVWGTDPLVPDTDGDGVSDGLEIVNYSDPLDPEVIFYSLDTDGDGINNHDEVSKYDTNPNLADTDGDGVSDWVEIFQSFTDPLVDEFGEVNDLLEIKGFEYTDSTGNWQNQGESVSARDRRGSLSYALEIPESGSYLLEIEGRQHNAYSDVNYFELLVEVDGISSGRQTLTATYDQSGTVNFYLPHLSGGDHTVTIQWLNGATQTTLEVIALRLQAVSGPDLDGNGIVDWIDTRLSRMSTLDEGQTFSSVSPYTLEGASYTLKQLSVQSDYSTSPEGVESISPRQGLIGKYYAHVALNPEGETAIQVSDQGGAVNFAKTVTWTETNVMTQKSKRVRKEDSLLLAAFLPESSSEDIALIEIFVPDGSVEVFGTSADSAIDFCFEQVGTYEIKASVQSTESAMTVEVVDAELGANPMVYVGGQDRQWTPQIPDGVVLEYDLHLNLNEVTTNQEERTFELGAGSAQPGAIIARLGENGPIIDSTYVEAILDYRNSNGSWDVTEVFPDGSRLVEITIQLSDVPEALTIELGSIKAGVTFDDGLIWRTVTADDFDESGVYVYRMIIASGVDGSSCHKVNFYQGDTWIGGNY